MKLGILISGRGSNMAAIVDVMQWSESPRFRLSPLSHTGGFASCPLSIVHHPIVDR